jgi:hypothetical protein
MPKGESIVGRFTDGSFEVLVARGGVGGRGRRDSGGTGIGGEGRQQRQRPRLPAGRSRDLFEAETGHPFKNTGDCASHGAKGGTLGQFAGQAACVGTGGTFALAPGGWRCAHYPVPPNDELPLVLFNACVADLGNNAELVAAPDGRPATTYTATCFTHS